MNNTDPKTALLEDQCVRVCSRCKVEQPQSEFYFNQKKQIFNSWCKSCLAVDERNRRQARSQEDREQLYRKQNLRVKFGITPAQYDKMFDTQKGLCAICGEPETAKDPYRGIKRLAVDHNHETNKIRALLCSRCNTGIGNLKHDIGRLNKAILYLERYQ